MWRIYPRRVDSLDIELEDEIPWSFRNWGWLSHSDDVSVLMFLNEKPYFWWKDSGHQPENLNFFICEKESRQQRTKNALAFMNYLVGTDSHKQQVPFKKLITFVRGDRIRLSTGRLLREWGEHLWMVSRVRPAWHASYFSFCSLNCCFRTLHLKIPFPFSIFLLLFLKLASIKKYNYTINESIESFTNLFSDRIRGRGNKKKNRQRDTDT